jgi:hypothetical protein
MRTKIAELQAEKGFLNFARISENWVSFFESKKRLKRYFLIKGFFYKTIQFRCRKHLDSNKIIPLIGILCQKHIFTKI